MIMKNGLNVDSDHERERTRAALHLEKGKIECTLDDVYIRNMLLPVSIEGTHVWHSVVVVG